MGKVGAAAALAACVGVACAMAVTARADPMREPSVCALYRVDRARASSRECVSCHDGSISTPVFRMNMPGKDFGHPVGVEYQAAWTRDPGGYSGALPREVPLVDGKVACTSCHDGAARNPSRIVELRRGRDLCTACHRK
jgi:predicted CXXCH cytochrome family protein